MPRKFFAKKYRFNYEFGFGVFLRWDYRPIRWMEIQIGRWQFQFGFDSEE